MIWNSTWVNASAPDSRRFSVHKAAGERGSPDTWPPCWITSIEYLSPSVKLCGPCSASTMDRRQTGFSLR